MLIEDRPGHVARRALLRRILAGLAIVPTMTRWARAEGTGAHIRIDNFAFSPAALTVKKGTEVVWDNEDDIPHTILVIGTDIKSKTLDTEMTFAYRFERPGTYNYICSLHPHMKGKLTVTS